MAKSESRIQKTPLRQYHGQSDAESLVNWLNVTEDLVGRARIIEVVNAFFRATYLEAATEHKMTRGKDGFFHEEMTPHLELLEAVKKKLNRLLAYYTVVPSIGIPASTQTGETSFLVHWRSAPGSKMARHSSSAPHPGPGRKWKKHYQIPGGQMGEIGALLNALELIKSGLISKIAGCRCGKFYFKKFAHQRFCSQKCKLTEFRANEEVRAKRNEYARKLYHLHKTGNVK
jgi:hypothetical protein